jgi:hypothetical protein
MFTDLVRSTSLIDLIGDEAWNHLVRWHDKTFQGLFGWTPKKDYLVRHTAP